MDLPLSNVASVTQNDQLNNVVAMSEAGSGNAACVNETKVSANIQKIAVRVAANVCPSEQTALCAGRSGATTMSLQPSLHAADRSLLFSTEFLHRVKNEYACAISLASILAARSSNEETKAALTQVIDQLHALASVHEILRPPLTTALSDLGANLTQLCRVMTSSRLAQRGIELNLAIAEPVLLDAKRCWRAELIVSELITNASRHAFVSRAGRILVAVKTASGQVVCRVSDDGSPTATLKRGLGTELIEALAADLDGYVERLHKASGTTVTLCFPQDLAERSTALESRRSRRL